MDEGINYLLLHSIILMLTISDRGDWRVYC